MFGKWPARFTFEWHRRNVIAAATAVFLVFVYFWQLGSMTPGLGPGELANLQNSHSLHALYAHPANAPHNIFDWALIKTHHLRPLYFRAVSAVFAIIFIGCFYRVSASWFGPFIGWISTLLLATTPLVVVAGRNANTDIMFLAPAAIAAVYFWLTRSEKPSKIKLLTLSAAAALYLYTPGSIYLLLIGVIAIRATLAKIIKQYPAWLTAVSVLLIAVIAAPLVLACVHAPASIKTLLLVPSKSSLLAYASQVGWMAVGLVWQTGKHYDLQVGRLGFMSFAQSILAIFGLYAFWTRARSKIYGLLLLVALAIVGAGLSQQPGFMLTAVISVCILGAAGLRYLLIEWQGVFPRNPLPRSFAAVLVTAVTVMAMYYGVRYGLAAWPHSIAIRDAYMLKYH